MDFYLYLPSNTGDYIDNTLSHYRVKLPEKLDLQGEWEVALVEISYPATWFNVGSKDDAVIAVVFNDAYKEYRKMYIPFNNYNTVDGLCDAINYTLDRVHSFDGETVNFRLRYDQIMHRVVLKPTSDAEPNANLVTLSKKLAYMLGFTQEVIITSEGKIEVVLSDGKKVGERKVPLNRLKWSSRSDDEDKQMFEYLSGI